MGSDAVFLLEVTCWETYIKKWFEDTENCVMNSFIICKLPKYCCVILTYLNNFLIIEEIYLTTISVAKFMRYMNEWIWSTGGMILTGQSGTLCKRACSSATLLNIIPHKLAWDRTRTSALKISAYQLEPWHDCLCHTDYSDPFLLN